MNRKLITALLSLFVLCSQVARSDGQTYVSQNELGSEIGRRKADVERTSTRLTGLNTEEQQALAELENAKTHAVKTEEMVATRAKVFYRISRRGKALKYLLGSDSPVQVLKRFNQLKHLLEDGVKDRQRATMRLEHAKSNLDRIVTEKTSASEFLSMLEQALDELKSERDLQQQ